MFVTFCLVDRGAWVHSEGDTCSIRFEFIRLLRRHSFDRAGGAVKAEKLYNKMARNIYNIPSKEFFNHEETKRSRIYRHRHMGEIRDMKMLYYPAKKNTRVIVLTNDLRFTVEKKKS